MGTRPSRLPGLRLALVALVLVLVIAQLFAGTLSPSRLEAVHGTAFFAARAGVMAQSKAKEFLLRSGAAFDAAAERAALASGRPLVKPVLIRWTALPQARAVHDGYLPFAPAPRGRPAVCWTPPGRRVSDQPSSMGGTASQRYRTSATACRRAGEG